MPKVPKTENINERVATLETRQDSMGDSIERLDRSQQVIQSEFSAAIKELNVTMNDVRVTNEGIQKTNEGLQREIQQVTGVIQNISSNMNALQTAVNSFANIQNQMDEFKRESKESIKKLHERIDGVDGKGKIDILKLLANGAVVILGGSAALTIALYLIFTYIFKIPGMTP